jgi:16S rRNA (guanine527-N7)-methyltransferase
MTPDAALGQLGIALPDDLRARLLASLDLLQRFHAATNLVGDAGAMALAAHVAEAWTGAEVALAALGREPARIIDVGSGAGLEALVLALRFPGATVVAVEPRRKRATFIELAADAARVRNLQVRAQRLEEGRLGGGFDVADARAVWSPCGWLERARALVAVGGVALVHASRKSRVVADGWKLAQATGVTGGDHAVLAFVRESGPTQ